SYAAPPCSPSFPTRRSSDLVVHRSDLYHAQLAATAAQLDDRHDRRIQQAQRALRQDGLDGVDRPLLGERRANARDQRERAARAGDRKSTRLNSSHVKISYAV